MLIPNPSVITSKFFRAEISTFKYYKDAGESVIMVFYTYLIRVADR